MNLGNWHFHWVIFPVAIRIVSDQETKQAPVALKDINLQKDFQVHHICQKLHPEAKIWHGSIFAWLKRNQKLRIKRRKFKCEQFKVEFKLQRACHILNIVMTRCLNVQLGVEHQALPIRLHVVERHFVSHSYIRLDLYCKTPISVICQKIIVVTQGAH